MPRYGPTGHPIDPSECKNGLGESCTPIDCIIDHKINHKCKIKRIKIQRYVGDVGEYYWLIIGIKCNIHMYSKRWDWALNKALDHLVQPRRTLDHQL